MVTALRWLALISACGHVTSSVAKGPAPGGAEAIVHRYEAKYARALVADLAKVDQARPISGQGRSRHNPDGCLDGGHKDRLPQAFMARAPHPVVL